MSETTPERAASSPDAGLAQAVVVAWDRAVLAAIAGDYDPGPAEFGDVADAIRALRAALPDEAWTK